MPSASNTLTKHESLEILASYQQTPSLHIRNRLVQLNIGLVRREAYRFMAISDESFDDLMQVGSLGLIKSVERFDPKKGFAFSTFAIPHIRGEIRHYLRDKSNSVRIPRRWQELLNRAEKPIRQLQETLNRQPNEQEIADTLGISVEEWQAAKVARGNRNMLSLDAPISASEGDTFSLGDSLTDGQYRSFQLAQEDKIHLQQALSQLNQRTQEVIELIFLRDLTKKETAKRLGITTETVTRRLTRGLSELKLIMNKSV
ncbi:MAG: sigma-70 family RNA polymerase sigma factor [Phormidesmis sp.]